MIFLSKVLGGSSIQVDESTTEFAGRNNAKTPVKKIVDNNLSVSNLHLSNIFAGIELHDIVSYLVLSGILEPEV